MLRNEWNKEIEVPILSRHWYGILISITKSVNEAQITTYKIKNKFRLYWTPLCFYRKGLSKTEFHWRCNKDSASLKHKFLQCPKLTKS